MTCFITAPYIQNLHKLNTETSLTIKTIYCRPTGARLVEFADTLLLRNAVFLGNEYFHIHVVKGMKDEFAN